MQRISSNYSPRVKICCISSIEEADIAIQMGANALGLVSSMPSGPGVISESLIAEIARIIPPAVTSVLLTSFQSSDAIIAQHFRCRTNAIQICDQLTSGSYQELRDVLPGIPLIQVIHVSGEESIKKAEEISQKVDALLLDSGGKSTGKIELGGTGRTHNWGISARICNNVNIPVFLAGGLNPDNVVDAIQTVHPYAVDVCSGVRSENQLDSIKLTEFMSNIQNGI